MGVRPDSFLRDRCVLIMIQHELIEEFIEYAKNDEEGTGSQVGVDRLHTHTQE